MHNLTNPGPCPWVRRSEDAAKRIAERSRDGRKGRCSDPWPSDDLGEENWCVTADDDKPERIRPAQNTAAELTAKPHLEMIYSKG